MDFWNGKRVLITGHTGFKGSWLSEWLLLEGAKLTGFALPPENENSLFCKLGLEKRMNSVYGDIRDLSALEKAFFETMPEIVFHLAAQPIVLESYQNPLYTYETNVLGTLHLLECVRKGEYVHSLVNVTTDKVYENNDEDRPFCETDKLDGFDPYSNSKSCSELVTHSFDKSFLKKQGVAVSTARAGNVIGGGDNAPDRLIPDCVRAALQSKPVMLRNPYSIRPFQHVLEPLYVYMLIAEKQYSDLSFCGAYNVGPEKKDCITTGALTELFCKAWGNGLCFETACTDGPHEAKFLKLNCEKLKKTFGWQPKTDIEEAVHLTVDYYKRTLGGESAAKVLDDQITSFERR